MGHFIKHTIETKELISISRKGKYMETENHKWKGESVGYRALHNWVDRTLGSPQHCAFCNDTSEHRYHWANLSGLYLRNRRDWIRLCPKCHYAFDHRKKEVKEGLNY